MKMVELTAAEFFGLIYDLLIILVLVALLMAFLYVLYEKEGSA